MSLPKFNEASYAHFITTKTFRNKPLFEDGQCCEILLTDIDFYRNKLGFKLLGYCIMPDHLHLIVWWDVDKHPKLTISKVMHGIKSHAARQVVDYLYHTGRRGPLTSSRYSSGQGTRATHTMTRATAGTYPRRRMSEQKYQIWQPSFYDFNIYSEKKLQQKLDYIHYNPVRAGLCEKPDDWPWSSYLFYKSGQKGKITIDTIL